MRLLLCGAGKVARELLKRLSEGWEVAVIDKRERELRKAEAVFSNIIETYAEDASSPVVLDNAGIKDFDYVLAMTDNDDVNLVIAKYAREKGAPHTLALTHEVENKSRFEEAGVRTVMTSSLVAQTLFYYLQDPRLRVMPIASGPATLIEFSAEEHFQVVGQEARYFSREGGRLVALYRDGELLFPEPDIVIEKGDRLVMLGEEGTFPLVCGLLECGATHFPLSYGRGMVLVLPKNGKQGELSAFLDEGLFFLQHSRIQGVNIITQGHDREEIDPRLSQWTHEFIEVSEGPREGSVIERVRECCKKNDIGIVALPPPSNFFLKTLLSSSITGLAMELRRPLLLARRTAPYKRIVVPFNGRERSRDAFMVASHLASQLGVKLSVCVVVEPEVITGEDRTPWLEGVREQIVELSHTYKVRVEEIVREGNPVHELASLSEEVDLMVMGVARKDKGPFSRNVAEHLARKAECSVLLAP